MMYGWRSGAPALTPTPPGSPCSTARRCPRLPARSAPAASPARRSYRRWRSLRRGAAHDGDALVEALAARLGRDVGVVLQRQVDDAPLDRGHGRRELFVAVAAPALGGAAGGSRECVVGQRLQPAALHRDRLLGLPPDAALVREHLQRVERLAVLLDH